MTLRKLAVVLPFLAQSVGACGGGETTSSPPNASPTPPPRDLRLFGNVQNTAGAPLPGVRVDIVGGSQAGLSTTTNARGFFEFSAPFSGPSVTLRATGDGYQTRTELVPAQSGPPPEVTGVFGWTAISMESVVPPVDVSGQYTMTLVADPSCDLPAELRSRTYVATVNAVPPTQRFPPNTRFAAKVSGAQFLKGYDAFEIFVSGNDVNFAVDTLDPGVVEQLAPTSFLSVNGEATPTVRAGFQSMTAPFWGSFLRCEAEMGAEFICPPANQRAFCSSTNHQLILTRQ